MIEDWLSLRVDLPLEAKLLCDLGIEFSKNERIKNDMSEDEIAEHLSNTRKIYSQLVSSYISLVKRHFSGDEKDLTNFEKDFENREKRLIELEDMLYATLRETEKANAREKAKALLRGMISRMSNTVSIIFRVIKDSKENWIQRKDESKIKFVRTIIIKRIFNLNSICQRILNYYYSYYTNFETAFFVNMIQEKWKNSVARYLTPSEEEKILERFNSIKKVLDLKVEEKKLGFATRTGIGRELEAQVKDFLVKVEQSLIVSLFYSLPTYDILERIFTREEIRSYWKGLTPEDEKGFWKNFVSLAIKRALPVEIVKEKVVGLKHE
jgi:sulfur relay (sulfurtransferase) DsrC/TusE family protein